MDQRYCRETLVFPAKLLTERLCLRRLRADDEDVLWEIDSDAEVMRFVFPPSTDREAHREETLRDLESGQRFKFFYAICRLEQDIPEGWIFVRPTEDGQWLELGYRLRRSAWGKGPVPEAATAMMRFAVEHWRADRFIALILPENENSKKAALKMGLKFESLSTRYYGELHEFWVRRY